MGARPRWQSRARTGALPYTLEWAVFPLKDVVTGPDTYDFTTVDAMLDSIAARGHQAVIRFYVDNPGDPSALPQYLIDGGTDTSRTYDFHDNEKKSFSPNYDDPNVQQMFLHFVAALGNRYDGDPRIGYITAGLYGFWGEEHTYPYNGAVSSQNPTGINWMPSDAFRAQLVEAWDDAFDETFIQNRYPTEATKAHGMGYHDDSFGYATLEGVSWHFIPKLKKQGEADAWQHAPIGGELYPPIQTCIFSQPVNCPNMDPEGDYKALESIQGAHATWLINQKAFTVGYTGDDLTRAQQASAAMGYTLQATRTSATYHGAKATVASTLRTRDLPRSTRRGRSRLSSSIRRARSWPPRPSSPHFPRFSRARLGRSPRVSLCLGVSGERLRAGADGRGSRR